jgi:hypothetical protein
MQRRSQKSLCSILVALPAYLNTFGVDSTPSKIPCKGICHGNAQKLQTAIQAKIYEDKQYSN